MNPREAKERAKAVVRGDRTLRGDILREIIPSRNPAQCGARQPMWRSPTNVALRVPAERLIAAYVAPDSDRPAIVNELIVLFDEGQRSIASPKPRPWRSKPSDEATMLESVSPVRHRSMTSACSVCFNLCVRHHPSGLIK
jgi:hypothetical protein